MSRLRVSAALSALVIGALTAGAFAGQKGSAKRPQKQAAINSSMIREIEQALSDLGYWTGPVDGKWDEASRHALIAFQKVEYREITGRPSRKELEALSSAARPEAREGGAPHIEIDLSRQVLFMVDGSGRVARILPVSTGNGEEFTSEGWTRRAITPEGRFKVSRKIEGRRISPLGVIYHPVYFLGGVAIHGYPSVPARPASHGCVRIPMFAAKEFNRIIPLATSIIVHNGGPGDPRDDEPLPTAKSNP